MTLKFQFDQKYLEAGLDEAGAGCLAGDVYAAAVIMPNEEWFEEYKEEFSKEEQKAYELLITRGDSKKMTKIQRNCVRKFIETYAIDFAIGICTPNEIDKINILNARFRSMHRAISKLKVKPTALLVDGNRFNKYIDPETKKEIKHFLFEQGDSKYISIAAASIIAKTYRDNYTLDLHKKYPKYSFDTHKGYGTKKHYQEIKDHGALDIHRKSFKLYS